MELRKRLPKWYKLFFLAFLISATFSIFYFQSASPRHDAGPWPLMFAGFPWIILGILPLESAIGVNFLILIAIGFTILKKEI